MSTMSTQARARALLPAGLSRPRLTVVPRIASRAPRIPFVILVVLVLGGGLIGLLLVNTALQRGAYEIADLQSRSSTLATQEQTLQMQVAHLRQPRRVAEAALALGMVRNDSPAFLDLGTGKVSGAARPAGADDTPIVGIRPGVVPAGVSKSMPLLAGAANSGSTGVERVPRERPAAAEEQAPDGQRTDAAGQTRVASTDQTGSRDTNNTSNTR